ncbi:MAG TPA: c-type cytochrome [Actinomycetota bacterium]|nr:c-type cytochrome [Actinomycetota bacterium]
MLIGFLVTSFLRRNEPELFDSMEDHFKYGSFGSEARAGVPDRLWRVLPEVFPDLLPEGPGSGYERFGFLYEEGRSRPIGTSFREQPVGLIGLNCAVCHVGTVRDSPESKPQIVLGMPANQFDLQKYLNFLRAVVKDERFSPDKLMTAIEKDGPDMPWWEGLLYRYVVIPKAEDSLQDVDKDFEWMDSRPEWGPGRVDTFNPYKVLFEFDMDKDETVGTSDLPPIWNQRQKAGMDLHWDGNNSSVSERNKSAAIGSGASEESLDLESMKRIEDWILDLSPPAFPSEHIDRSRAARGTRIYEAECASCHAFDGAEVGNVEPINEIGTDRERLDSFTSELVGKMNTLGSGRSWEFSHFKKTEGYANMPLDGLWLRAPYLHNGSVPTLRSLLFPEERPATFTRNYNVYDFVNAGFVSSGAEAEKLGFTFDTKLRGNSNVGHIYGAVLTPEEKLDLLEFLKTL